MRVMVARPSAVISDALEGREWPARELEADDPARADRLFALELARFRAINPNAYRESELPEMLESLRARLARRAAEREGAR
jgi:hypothetical protein